MIEIKDENATIETLTQRINDTEELIKKQITDAVDCGIRASEIMEDKFFKSSLLSILANNLSLLI